MTDKLHFSDQDLENLFRTQLPSEEIPRAMAERIQKSVMAEVAVSLQKQRSRETVSTREHNWFDWIVDRFPRLQIGSSLALAGASALILLLLVQFGAQLIPNLRQLTQGPQTAQQPGDVAAVSTDQPQMPATSTPEPTSTPQLTGEPQIVETPTETPFVEPEPTTDNAQEGIAENSADAPEVALNLPTETPTETPVSANPENNVATTATSTVAPIATATPNDEGSPIGGDDEPAPTRVLPTDTPLPTRTPTAASPQGAIAQVPTATNTIVARNATPINTATNSPTPLPGMPTATKTNTPTPTATEPGATAAATATPTATQIREATETPTVTPTRENAPIPSVEPTLTTATPVKTATTPVKPTTTPTSAGGDLQPPSATPTSQPPATATPTATATATATATTVPPTFTPTLAPTFTPTPIINRQPDAADDSVQAVEDAQNVAIDPTINDSDPDGDALTVSIVAAPNNGSIVLQGNTILYTPKPNYFGDDVIAYAVRDQGGLQSIAYIYITVTPVNDAPVAGDEPEVKTNQGQAVTIDVLNNDSDLEGAPLTIILPTDDAAKPKNGTLEIQGSSIRYTPRVDFYGDDWFTYTVSDNGSQNAISNSARVTIKVNGAPTTGGDRAVTTNQGQAVTINLFDNARDPENASLTLVISAGRTAHGTVQPQGGGAVLYTPDNAYSGEDSFTYMVSDGQQNSASAKVNIKINGAPTAVDDPNITTNQGQTATINVLANDSDPEGTPLTVVLSSNRAAHGSLQIQNGAVVYTPDGGFFGEDSFTYVASDGRLNSNLAKVIVKVNGAPRASDEPNVVTNQGQAVTINVLNNDSDPENAPLTLVLSTNPLKTAHGTVQTQNGAILYTPDNGFIGEDSFTYMVSDGQMSSNPAKVTIRVNAQPTIETTPTTQAQVDIPYIYNVRFSDVDIGDILTIHLTSDTPSGWLDIAQTSNVSAVLSGTAQITGIHHVVLTVNDEVGGFATQTFDITVTAPPPPPPPPPPTDTPPPAGQTPPEPTTEPTAVTSPLPSPTAEPTTTP
ncbi:MAG: tandem-95 repeat protein [Caldilineaceae bacterium]